MQEYQETTKIEEVPVIKRASLMKKFAGVLFVALVALGGWAYYKKVGFVAFGVGAGKNLTDAQQKAMVSNYLAQVGKHMLLPINDEPVVATVDDPAALTKQQAFFTGSIKGDIVLIFPKTQRAILYSPSRNKIVNAGPVISGSQNKQADTPAPAVETAP